MRVLASILLAAAVLAAADEKADHKHSKTQKAHDHGAAEINFAIDGKSADIEFHAPAMAVIGFEYTPKTAADKKKQAVAIAALKANFAKMVVFEPKAGCSISAKSVEVEQEEADHAEIDGDFHAICAQPLAGTRVTFAVTKTYPGITAVKIQAVGASGSTGAEIKSDQGAVVLPR